MPTVTEILQTMEYGPSPESDLPAQTWLDEHHRSFDLYINGVWVQSDERFSSHNPANGHLLAEIAQANATHVDDAVRAAEHALDGWRSLGGFGRAKYLYALARAMQRHSRMLAVLETLDNGKPIRETRDVDVPLAIRHFYHHAGWAQLLSDQYPEHESLGVVGQIVPWNFPLLMLAWKVAPALAAGNTVVFKPAELTSLTALYFVKLCEEIGLPPGVFNLVTGGPSTGEAIVGHPDIAKIAFTGSTEVGRRIREATAGSGKKLSLELGGKSPFIVFADADLDAAVEGVVNSIWFNQGQVCCAGSRLLVQESVEGLFHRKLRDRMVQIRVGDPLDKCTDMGALISTEQLQRVRHYIELGRQEGGDVFQTEVASLEQGCFCPPTLISGLETSSTLMQEEIFGPVLVSVSFRTPNEAVELANNSRFGLAASIWSESINVALEMAPRVQAGVVWINTANQFDASCGFGGYKESGFGREGGHEGMLEYLKRRSDPVSSVPSRLQKSPISQPSSKSVDQTNKLFVGGTQTRPDSGYSHDIFSGDHWIGSVSQGNRKDIRNAVEAARKSTAWSKQTSHARAQVLFFMAENLSDQQSIYVDLLKTVMSECDAKAEVEKAIERVFLYAAWADKLDGRVHRPPVHGLVTALHEPLGVIGVVCPDESPLVALVSLCCSAIALGNRVVVVPSTVLPTIATPFYKTIEASDVPGGVINLITGDPMNLGATLASHADVDAVWFHQMDRRGCAEIEKLSAPTLKRTWVDGGRGRDWWCDGQTAATDLLRHASQIKNVWVPYGV